MDLNVEKPIFGLASDFHLDFMDLNPEFFEWRGKYLLLAGDLGEEDFLRKQAQRGFWDKISLMADQVFVIAGNHEHYRSEIDATHEHLTEYLKDWSNIRLLHNEAVDLGYLVLYGATMWTDFNRQNPVMMLDAKLRMNDYKEIRVKRRGYSKLRVDDVLLEHAYARQGLESALEQYPDRPFLVMTHHAPTHESVHPSYRNHDLTDAYCNRFERLIENTPQIQAWVHGHVHWLLNYDVCGCRVLCNPRGYPNERPKDLPPYQPISFTLEGA